jgi:hypothetical protein
MRRRPGAAAWRENRRFGQAHQKLGKVGRGVVDRIVYDLGKKVDALVDLLRCDGAKADHERPPVE